MLNEFAILRIFLLSFAELKHGVAGLNRVFIKFTVLAVDKVLESQYHKNSYGTRKR